MSAPPTLESVTPEGFDHPARVVRRFGAASWWLLRVVATVQLALLLAQPVFAGLFLSGHFAMLGVHLTGANMVSYSGYALVVCAVVAGIAAGRWWPAVVAVLLVAGETVQYFAGMAARLYLHVPLGVALVVLGFGFAVGVWLPVSTRWIGGNDRHGAANVGDQR